MMRLPSLSVSGRGAARLREGQPWVRREDVTRAPTFDKPLDDCVRVVDGKDRLLGSALWSKTSPIAARLYSREERFLDEELLAERIVTANERRRALLPGFDAYRVVHAEADLLPGVFIDRYADVAVVQSMCAGLDAREAQVARVLVDTLGVRLVVARDDGAARDFEELPRRKGILFGEGSTTVAFHDAGSPCEADVLEDGKTGSFLDQQENHARVASYVTGRDVKALDAFTYHGGFALALAGAGAEVLALDESSAAVARARANAARSQRPITVETRNAFDALRELESEGRRFDVVVIDPPALAKRRSALPAAERGYKELNLRAFRLAKPGGLVVSCSCSGRLSVEKFGAIVADAARDAGRAVQLLERRGAGRDHPPLLQLPETEYLKCWILRVME